MTAAVPSWPGVAMSLLLVAGAIGLAARARLGLSREMVIAAVRAAAQLAAVGAVLMALFTHAGLPGSVAWLAGMVIVAGRVASGRAGPLPGAFWAAVTALAISSGITLGALLLLDVVTPEPRVVVPVGGMIVASSMQATGLALRRLREDLESARATIETRLTLGVPIADALLPHRRGAVQTALAPVLDATKVVGLISLPGAMTGLIMAGVDPFTAIRYQIVVMYMQLAAATMATLLATRLAEQTTTDRTAQRLRSWSQGLDKGRR